MPEDIEAVLREVAELDAAKTSAGVVVIRLAAKAAEGGHSALGLARLSRTLWKAQDALKRNYPPATTTASKTYGLNRRAN